MQKNRKLLGVHKLSSTAVLHINIAVVKQFKLFGGQRLVQEQLLYGDMRSKISIKLELSTGRKLKAAEYRKHYLAAGAHFQTGFCTVIKDGSAFLPGLY